MRFSACLRICHLPSCSLHHSLRCAAGRGGTGNRRRIAAGGRIVLSGMGPSTLRRGVKALLRPGHAGDKPGIETGGTNELPLYKVTKLPC